MRTNAQSDFTRLLEDYCRSVGMGDFEIDPEGGLFEIEDVKIVVRHDDDFERISMVAPVGALDPAGLGRVAPHLLQLNTGLALSGGQAFCANMESGEVSLQQSLPLKQTAASDFDAGISVLVEKTRAARELFEKLTQPEAPAAPTERRDAETDGSHIMLRA